MTSSNVAWPFRAATWQVCTLGAQELVSLELSSLRLNPSLHLSDPQPTPYLTCILKKKNLSLQPTQAQHGLRFPGSLNLFRCHLSPPLRKRPPDKHPRCPQSGPGFPCPRPKLTSPLWGLLRPVLCPPSASPPPLCIMTIKKFLGFELAGKKI